MLLAAGTANDQSHDSTLSLKNCILVEVSDHVVTTDILMH